MVPLVLLMPPESVSVPPSSLIVLPLATVCAAAIVTLALVPTSSVAVMPSPVPQPSSQRQYR